MLQHLYLSARVLGVLALLYVSLKIRNWAYYYRERRQRGCSEPPTYAHRDPLLGLDLSIVEKRAYQNGQVFAWNKDLFRRYGRTYQVNSLGTRVIRTMDKQNIKSILATNFHDFGLEPIREGSATPFFDRGINTTDGSFWEYCRGMVKPTFSRAEICNFTSLERHLERLVALIPKDGSTIDLQPLFSRLFLDTSTEFLFGQSTDSLLPSTPPESELFIQAYDQVMVGFGKNVRMGKLRIFNYDKKWLEAIQIVHQYVERFIDQALAATSAKDGENGDDLINGPINNGGKRYILLHEMAKMTQNKGELRSQILAVFMPSRDTTAWLVSNVFHVLARRPDIWARLRRTVAEAVDGGKPLSFELLKSIKYLQWVINESHRIYPISEQASRACLKDSVLPAGGGRSGTDPIFVRKGDQLAVHFYCLHQDKTIWGEDAEEFRPERWENLKPVWDFIPFGGGPRNCPAQQLVTTEAAYIIVRMVQKFTSIENRNANPWTETWRIGPLNRYGVKVALTPSE